MSSVPLTFEDISLPTKLSELPRMRENKLRVFYVDGREVRIRRDGIEALYAYEIRTSFVLARSFNPREHIDELIANSRIALNKQWSPLVDDETGTKVRAPYYPDEVEERFQRVSSLPAYNALLAKIPSPTTETIYYEPETVSPPRPVAPEEKETSAEEPSEEAEVEVSSSLPVITIAKLADRTLRLSAIYPLFVTEQGKNIRKRLTKLAADKERDTILASVFEGYSGKLTGMLENIGAIDINMNENSIVVVARFRTEEAAKKAGERLGKMITDLEPVELKRAKGSVTIYFAAE